MLLDVQNVHKTLGSNHILKGITFQMGQGESVSLVGENGAGKSTLISLIVGLRAPNQGIVRLNGLDPRTANGRKAFAYVHQNVSFPNNIKAREVLSFVAAITDKALPPDEMIELFELSDLLSRPAGVFSGGETKRLAFAAALVMNPPLLVLDEVMNSLDIHMRMKMTDYLRDYVAKGGSVLFTAHLENERKSLGSKELFIVDGVLKEQL